MSDGTNTKAWQRFLSELKREGMDFSDIQHADDKTRVQLLDAMPALSPIERASVTTTWKKLNGGGSAGTSSTPSRDPMPTPQQQYGGSSSKRSSTHAIPVGNQSQSRSGRSRGDADSSFFGQQVQSQSFDPVQDYVPPQMVRGKGGSSPRGQAPKVQPPMLNVPVMNVGGGSGDLPTLLRAALDRGDCGTALPLASEMLQSDPVGLCHMLNEYLPQLSVDQLKTILGVGSELEGSPSSPPPASSGRRGGSAQYSPTGKTPRGSSSRSPNRQSMQSSQQFYDPDSPGIEMTSQPTINGQPLTAGQVLTAPSMQAQYGPRFTATCNGRALIFPYCVQRGDRIIVRSAQERLL